jgi:hypothetical protein
MEIRDGSNLLSWTLKIIGAEMTAAVASAGWTTVEN